MTDPLGHMNVGGPLSGASGALGLVRQILEVAFGTSTDWVASEGNEEYIRAILSGSLDATSSAGGYKREDVTPQVAKGDPGPGTRSFTTVRRFGEGRTRAVMNGVRHFSLVQNTPTDFDFDPYGDGYGPRAGDVLVIEEVVTGWEELSVPGGVSTFVTTSTYLLGSYRVLLNGVFWEDGVSTTDGKTWTVEPYGPGSAPLPGDTLHVEGPVDAFDVL